MKQETIDRFVSQEYPDRKREDYATDAQFKEEQIRLVDKRKSFIEGLKLGYKRYAAELCQTMSLIHEKIEAKFLDLSDADDLAKAWLEYQTGTPVEIEESVSEKLEEEIELSFINNECHIAECTGLSLSTYKRIALHFANWQKKQDQSTIELAEDHAMLAGMEKMKEQMMKDAVEGHVMDYPSRYVYCKITELEEYMKDFKEGDKVKLIVIKED